MKSATITSVLDTEYMEYGMYTIEQRAIPSAVDGFKPTQRKAAHTASRIWRRGDEKPMRVYQLAGKMAAECAYHHGDASGSATIVGMAQTFKNSLPVLEDIGQFGSLRVPEASAPRYISTRLSPAFRLLYRDEELLEPRVDDGAEVEPKFFLPVVPAVLLNGSSGIAVGFATNILNRRPEDLVRCCLAVLDGKKFKEPAPWWRDFSGTVEKVEGQYVMRGAWERTDSTTVTVTELPPSTTYVRYEAFLDSLVEKGKAVRWEDHSAERPRYVVKFTRAQLQDMVASGGVEKTLKLTEAETENITCLDEHGKLREFASVDELVRWFVGFRLGYYTKRKDRLAELAAAKDLLLSNRARFVSMVLDGSLVLSNRPRADVEGDLARHKFDRVDGSYSYLMGMPVHSLTKETYEELLRERGRVAADLLAVRKRSPEEMYRSDLNELLRAVKS